MQASNTKLSAGLEHPYDDDAAYEVITGTTPATEPATARLHIAVAPATVPATARPAAAPARPKQVNKKKQFTAPFPIPLSEFKDYVSKKKKETYREGNGFLFDYQVSQDNDGSVIITRCEFIVRFLHQIAPQSAFHYYPNNITC